MNLTAVSNQRKGGGGGEKGSCPEQMRGGRECGRTWQENEAQKECLVATDADVVCETSHNAALPPHIHQKRAGLWPWAEAPGCK